MNEDIDECIKAIRLRMRHGHTKKQITEGLFTFFPIEHLFLCYQAAEILETTANEKNKNSFTMFGSDGILG